MEGWEGGGWGMSCGEGVVDQGDGVVWGMSVRMAGPQLGRLPRNGGKNATASSAVLWYRLGQHREARDTVTQAVDKTRDRIHLACLSRHRC